MNHDGRGHKVASLERGHDAAAGHELDGMVGAGAVDNGEPQRDLVGPVVDAVQGEEDVVPVLDVHLHAIEARHVTAVIHEGDLAENGELIGEGINVPVGRLGRILRQRVVAEVIRRVLGETQRNADPIPGIDPG